MGGVTGFRGRLYRDDGVVLRVQKLGESDRIITVLTRGHGRVRAVAKGIRRITSRFGGRLEPFGHVDLQLSEGRSLDVVSQVEGINLFGKRFLNDYSRYTVASAIAEAAEQLTPEEREPSLRLFLLSLGALRSLADGQHPGLISTVPAAGLVAAGWAGVAGGAVCGTAGAHRAFSVPPGASASTASGAGRPAPRAGTDGRDQGDWAIADASERRSARGQWPGRRTAGGIRVGVTLAAAAERIVTGPDRWGATPARRRIEGRPRDHERPAAYLPPAVETPVGRVATDAAVRGHPAARGAHHGR
jgi:DNA repair protein RecO (recombination protein O)